MPAILKKQINYQAYINLEGSDVAELFWQLDDCEMAAFFNRLSMVKDLPFQLQAVTDCEILSDRGRIVMQRIGEYAHKQ